MTFCSSLVGPTVVSGELTTITLFIVFFLPVTFLSLRCLSAVFNSFYLLLCFPFVSQSFKVTFSAISIATFVFLISCSPPLSGHLLSASFSSPVLSTCPAHSNLYDNNFLTYITPLCILLLPIVTLYVEEPQQYIYLKFICLNI